MKNITKLFFAAAFLTAGMASAQTGGVGVGTTTPDASSALDVTSTTKGFLMPRMTTAQRTAIATPATGLQVYDTTTNSQWYFNGTVWVQGASKADGSKFTNDATNTRVALTNLSDGVTARPAGTDFIVKDNGWVGIGTNNPYIGKFMIDSDSNSGDYFLFRYQNLGATSKVGNMGLYQYNGSVTNASPGFQFLTANGSVASPTALVANQPMGTIFWFGHNGTSLKRSAQIYANTDAAHSATNSSAEIRFATTSPNQTATSDKMLLTSSGNLKVGNAVYPTARLDISGYIKLASTDALADASPSAGLIRYNGGLQVHNGTSWSTISSNLWINDNANAVAKLAFLSDGTTVRTLDKNIFFNDSGNVGIGIANPTTKFTVFSTTEGSSHISSRTNSSYMWIAADGTNGNIIRYGGSGTNSDVLTFNRTGGFENMRIAANGSLGIGVTTPVEKLEVNGAIKIGTTTTATPTAGTIRFNTTSSKFEGYNGTAWVVFH